MVAKFATGEIEDTRYEQPEKRKSGSACGRARAASLTQERRRAIALSAAAARWELE